jgi:5-methylcytosine-specific restriction endonuclease McrA
MAYLYTGKSRKYCSKKCMGQSYSKNRIGANHPAWKGRGLVSRSCLQCGAGFAVEPYVIDRGEGIFCSHACTNIYYKGNGKGACGPKSNFWIDGRNSDPKHRAKMLSHKSRVRRMKERSVTGAHTAEEWEALVVLCGNKCVKCGVSGNVVKLTQDHIIPISKGGTNNVTNLQPLCQSCNSKKGTKAVNYIGALSLGLLDEVFPSPVSSSAPLFEPLPLPPAVPAPQSPYPLSGAGHP